MRKSAKMFFNMTAYTDDNPVLNIARGTMSKIPRVWFIKLLLCKVLHIDIPPTWESKTWTLTANGCLNVKSLNFQALTAADMTVNGT